jgi:hypothetical protein
MQAYPAIQTFFEKSTWSALAVLVPNPALAVPMAPKEKAARPMARLER